LYWPQPEYPFIPIQPAIFPPPQPPALHSLLTPCPTSTPYLASSVPGVEQLAQIYRAARTPNIWLEQHESSHSRHVNRDPSHTRVEPIAIGSVDNLKSKDADPSTPILQRMSSGCFHDDDRRMYAKELIPLLKQELSLEVSQSGNLANTIFPADRLPFPVDNNLLRHLAAHSIWS
jgi:hypothetical protein